MHNDNIVISVESLSKQYRLGQIGTGTLSHDLNRWWHRVRGNEDPYLKIGESNDRSRGDSDYVWALKDISFEVKQGEILGIIGKNGAGKSTLLKILSRVTTPTTGQVKVKGRIASLLEVGTGFHPELTGRENIYLNGAILGMTKAEIKKKFDEIVTFSEVEKFIDTPVKRYSSGMYVRLAFAVAAHLEPEILIVDEVLAVGDASFQKKCLGKMGDVAKQGRTILFVSHNMGAIASLCMRVIMLNNGADVAEGEPATVIQQYQTIVHPVLADASDLSKTEHYGTGKARFISAKLRALGPNGIARSHLITGGSLHVQVDIQAFSAIKEANVALIFYDSLDYRVMDVNTALKGNFLSLEASQKAKVDFRLHDILLKPGKYMMGLWLGKGATEDIDGITYAAAIDVESDPDSLLHSETFPGIYQCRYDQHISVNSTLDAYHE